MAYTYRNYKVGDIIEVRDGSWSITIRDNEVIKMYGVDLRPYQFRIVQMDGVYPIEDNPASKTNDLFLQETSGKFHVFTNRKNTRLFAEPPCVLCGK
jgi:hypothetical protein